MAAKSPRSIRPYPKLRRKPGVWMQSRGAVKWYYLRQERPRVHARPWKVRTRHDPAAALEARAEQSIRGSLEERILYKALVDHGFIPGIDFTFQTSMLGGRAELGGLVADFVFPLPKVIVNPSSVWHTQSLANMRRDDDQTAILQSMGYMVLYPEPEIIHDQNMLEEWLARNITTLWGTSSQGLGAGAAANDMSYLDVISSDFYNRIEATLDAIVREVDR